MILSMLCKLPSWLGGGHRWRRFTRDECNRRSIANLPVGMALEHLRICRRCDAERVVKARKKTTKETT